MTPIKNNKKKILLTGATGYVGGRLAPMLLRDGYPVRAMGRSIAKLEDRPWASHVNTEIVQGDVLNKDALENVVNGCQVIFYLVHSMSLKGKDFEATDRKAAKNISQAAAAAGVERIIYLGGLGDFNDPLISKHLKSRNEVAQILKSGSVPVTYLKAAMILGSGSASFEIMRYLVDRLPIMITPRWVQTRSQPIAIRNVLGYLKGCVETDRVLGETFDIGGPDVLNYRKLFEIYAQEAGLKKRWIVPVPVLTPKLSAYWIHFVTPVPSAIAMPLSQGLKNEVVCQENRIQDIIPQRLISCQEAIQIAMEKVQTHQVESRWSDAGWLRPPEWKDCGDAEYSGGTVFECGYKARIKASPEEIWKPIVQIGGKTGYYYGDYLWHVRGIIDRLAGGVGLRRGRRHPKELLVGDTIDFWRVLDIKTGASLKLLAEMKLPGEALLSFKISPASKDTIELELLSQFLPKGLAGIVYWYMFFLFHEMVFSGMLLSIAKSIGKPMVSSPKRFTSTKSRSCVY